MTRCQRTHKTGWVHYLPLTSPLYFPLFYQSYGFYRPIASLTCLASTNGTPGAVLGGLRDGKPGDSGLLGLIRHEVAENMLQAVC